MFYQNQKILRIILAFGIFALLFVSLLSLSNYGMGRSGDMLMSHCPFMGEMSICDMTVFDHISIWQSLFAKFITPESALLLTSLIIVLSLHNLWSVFFPLPKRLVWLSKIKSKRTKIPILSFFVILFSQGILNPKLF